MTDPTMSEGIPEPTAVDEAQLAALGELLASDAIWAEPPLGLEARVLSAIGTEAGPVDSLMPAAPGLADRRYLRVIGAVAVAFLVVGVGLAILLAGDDPVRVELAGTELAPAASAVAELEDTPQGLRVLLEVMGLPPAETGTYYQGWVRNGVDGVTIGTFHMRGGDAEVELWAGVSSNEYPIITVTLQREGEGAASSGMVVLKGEQSD